MVELTKEEYSRKLSQAGRTFVSRLGSMMAMDPVGKQLLGTMASMAAKELLEAYKDKDTITIDTEGDR